MATTLHAYLTSLAEDSTKLSAFRADSDGEMKKAGLSDDEVAAVSSKDPTKISAALAAGNPGKTGLAAETTVLVVVV